MTCCTKMPSSCRMTTESCDCCTCTSTPITERICEPPCSYNHHPLPHHHEGCSCVHPVIICACNSCNPNDKEQEGTCHGHHSAANQPAVESLEEKKF